MEFFLEKPGSRSRSNYRIGRSEEDAFEEAAAVLTERYAGCLDLYGSGWLYENQVQYLFEISGSYPSLRHFSAFLNGRAAKGAGLYYRGD